MSQPNLMTNVDFPGSVPNMPPMQPMWDADGRLKGTDQDALHYSEYNQKDPVPQFQNGRVTNVAGISGNKFQMFTCDNNPNDDIKDHVLYGIQTKSPLSETFFSNANIKRVQDQIRYAVWTASGGKYQIGPQSDTELIVIMRAMFLQHGKFLPYQISEQVNELNQLCVDFALPKIMSEIEQYTHFQKDLEYLPIPLSHPQNLSSKGTKTLSSMTSSF